MTEPTPQQNSKTPHDGVSGVGKPKTDWDAVERDYRTGQYTLRELEAKHGADDGLIARKAKKAGWTQDLAIAIKQATNAQLLSELVSNEVSSRQQKVSTTIQVAATTNANVIMGHRVGLRELVDVKQLLLNQIKDAASNMTALAEVIEMVRNPDDNGQDKANDALRKAMGRSALVDDLKKLAEVDERLRKGQREAFSISDEPKSGDNAITDLIAQMSRSAFPVAK